MTSGARAERPRRPYVVAHVAVSVDGATVGFVPDVERFYALARSWREDVTLVGADTVLAQEPALRSAARPGPAADGPLLAVVDGRGRVTEWEALRDVGHWSRVLAVHCDATPPRPVRPAGRGHEELVVGRDRVDLAGLLRSLGERAGVGVVRVDSGGGLIGALLERGLVDEVSLLVHPVLVGGRGARAWHGTARHASTRLTLLAAERLDELMWLRYRLRGGP